MHVWGSFSFSFMPVHTFESACCGDRGGSRGGGGRVVPADVQEVDPAHLEVLPVVGGVRLSLGEHLVERVALGAVLALRQVLPPLALVVPLPDAAHAAGLQGALELDRVVQDRRREREVRLWRNKKKEEKMRITRNV